MARRIRSMLTLAATVAVVAAGLSALAPPAGADTTICTQYGTSTIQSGRYIVMNNVWGASTRQCINVTANGFQVTAAEHNKPTNGAPASYPAVYRGCHYGACTRSCLEL